MKPSIGLTTFNDSKPRASYTSVSNHYVRSIDAAGGLPFPIPTSTDPETIRDYLDRVDGLLFTGGVDVAPWRFGEEPIRQLGKIGFERDECEIRLLEGALARGMPVFGICRGHQLINIALGGSVFQDIHAQRPDSGGHYPEDFPVDELYHHITVEDPGSILAKVFGTGRRLVNSFHHQALARVAQTLKVTAISDDGLAEACELASSASSAVSGAKLQYLHTVQFHPESLTIRYPEFLGLFVDFVAASAAYGRKP